MAIYAVSTELFGELQLVADDIADARRRARAYGVRAPRATRRVNANIYALCDSCNSRPCCCARPSTSHSAG